MKKSNYFGSQNNAMATFRAQGEAAFSNMFGDGSSANEDNFDDDDESDYDGDDYEDNFVSGSARTRLGVGSIDSSTRVIAIKVANAHLTETRTVTLFGGFGAATRAAVADVTITSDTVPYDQLVEQSIANPFLLREVKFVAGGNNATSQLAEKFEFKHQDITGVSQTKPYYPEMFRSPNQFNAEMIEDKSFEFLANGETSLVFNILPQTSLKIITFISAATNLSRVLGGKAAVEVTNSSAPIGRPAIQVQVGGARPARRWNKR